VRKLFLRMAHRATVTTARRMTKRWDVPVSKAAMQE
jgi:hypothetical protein